jgi:hypothetical protein
VVLVGGGGGVTVAIMAKAEGCDQCEGYLPESEVAKILQNKKPIASAA